MTFFTVCPKDCFGSCSLEIEVEKGKVVKVRKNRHSLVNKGRICVKRKNYPNIVYDPERLLYPLRRIGQRGEGEFKRISWGQALDIIFEKLENLRGQYGPESVLYLHSNYQEIAFSDLKFNTYTGKIEFFCQQMEEKLGKEPLPLYHENTENKYSSPEIYNKCPLSLISNHALNKMNSQFEDISIFKEEPFILINPNDAENRGINDGEKVEIYNERGSLILKAIFTKKVLPGIVHTYFGWWDGVRRANLNKLNGEYISDIGDGTAFHNCLVEVQKRNREPLY